MPTVNFLWNPINDNIVKEFDENGNTVVEYTTEPDLYGNVISQHRGGQSSFFHFDGLGSTIAVTDAGGNVTDTQAYGAFGETTERTGVTPSACQFVGQQGYYTDDDAGTIEIRERAYRPRCARWMSIDPFMLYATDWDTRYDSPLSHPYSYCESNPSSYLDPSGLAATQATITIDCTSGHFPINRDEHRGGKRRREAYPRPPKGRHRADIRITMDIEYEYELGCDVKGTDVQEVSGVTILSTDTFLEYITIGFPYQLGVTHEYSATVKSSLTTGPCPRSLDGRTQFGEVGKYRLEFTAILTITYAWVIGRKIVVETYECKNNVDTVTQECCVCP
jgi:RHS repeat-associated protein